MFANANIESFKRVLNRIKEKPTCFDMSSYYNETECGTTCCIAGWAIMDSMSNSTYNNIYDYIRDVFYCSWLQGGIYSLGIGFEEGTYLFHKRMWPQYFQSLDELEGAISLIEGIIEGKFKDMTLEEFLFYKG